MRRKNRRILLTIDNCPAHPKLDNLSNLEFFFLPPNSTSKLQPLDQGIIKNFKSHYRNKILRYIVQQSDTNDASSLANNINVLDAVLWMTEAWDRVTDVTIKNCFKKARFIEEQIEIEEVAEELFDAGLNIALNGVSFEKYIEIDNDVHTCTTPNEPEIIQEVVREMRPDDNNRTLASNE